VLFRCLFSWWRRPPTNVAVVLYTRQGCHLCEDLEAQLEGLQRDYRFSLVKVDIDTDPELVRQHGECVPVVAINGRVRFWGRVNGVLLRRTLRGENNQ
jgi:glutaredoxin